jgi:hypothetical protein
MEKDRNHIVTQEETGEIAPIDAVEQRVDDKMDQLEAEAKKSVAEGLELDDEGDD